MGCFSAKPKKQKSYTRPTSVIRASIPSAPVSVGPSQPPTQLQTSLSSPTLPIVTSRFSLQDVQSADYTPHNSSRHVYKYGCPICLKYLSTVLVASCCGNYLCHFCVEGMKNRETTARCPMCNAEAFELTDVDPTADVKRYSDSPYSTYGPGKTSQGAKWVSTLEIVEEDQKPTQELEEEDSRESEKSAQFRNPKEAMDRPTGLYENEI